MVTAEPAPDAETLARARGRAAGEVRLSLRAPHPVGAAVENDNTTQTGELLTDDFAPVNVYDTMGDRRRKK